MCRKAIDQMQDVAKGARLSEHARGGRPPAIGGSNCFESRATVENGKTRHRHGAQLTRTHTM